MRKHGFYAALLAASMLFPALAAAQTPPRPAQPAQRPAQAPAGQQARPPAPAQQQAAIPQAAGQLILIRGSLTALDHANQTGNYTVLYSLGSDSLRAQTNPQGLAQSFAGFRQRNVDLSPVVFLNPRLHQPAAIVGGRLHLVGSFPTQPMQVNFDIWFEPSQGRWKFVQLNASLTPAAPQPPQQQQQQSPLPRQPQPQAPTGRRP